MTIEERINELGEKYEKQKEINKDLVDYNSRLLSQAAAATKRIIQQEKRIAELEKENAELKSIAEFQQSSNMKRHFEIQELEKENAELKGKENTVHTLDVLHKEAVRKYGETNVQLTKATELLKQWRQTTYAGGCDNVNLGRETEQFLKEIE